MLWNASAINGYTIEASDGLLGTVSDLLFDDDGWIVRWLVVAIGNSGRGRKVLLPLSALGQPDRALRHFPVKLTTKEVEDSPNVGTDQPVSRQMEADVYNYYGWDPYWGSSFFPISNAIATPAILPLHLWGATPPDAANAETRSGGGDPHLRSVAAVTGYHIHSTDGEIGHIEDFIVDDAGWRIRYITVDTRNWWPGRRVLILPISVREIDWAERLMHLDVNRQVVEDSPPYDPSITVDGAYEEKYLSYYQFVGQLLKDKVDPKHP